MEYPHGGVQGFGWRRIPGCYVTEFALHKAVQPMARGKLTIDESVVLEREIDREKEIERDAEGERAREREREREREM